MPLPPTRPEAGFKPVGQRFQFDCHPGVPCFNACCGKLNLVLTPYDILRLARNLGLSTGDLVENHTVAAQEKSRWPLIRLKMDEKAGGDCPFLKPEGCGVYPDRPSACRIYPLARAVSRGYGPGEVMEQFFVVEESHCQGFAEERHWTVAEWVADQGLIPYHRFNDRWMAVVTHPKGPGSGPEAEKNRRMFYLASYNLDRFRDFVFQTKFLDLFEIDPIRLSRLKDNDEELLALAMDWLAFAFTGEKTLKLKDGRG